jgi:hypothetical protein
VNAVASDGGGGSDFAVDLPAVTKVITGLTDAGSEMDGAGSSFPSSVDGGPATGLVADILSTFSTAGARLVEETGTLAELAQQATDNYGSADAAAAERMLWNGATS